MLLPLTLQANQIIYNGALQNGWANWSWATVNFANTAPVNTGNSNSISATCGGYSAVYLENSPFNAGSYTNLAFWIDGGTGGQSLSVYALTNGSTLSSAYTVVAPTNAWQEIYIPLSALGLTNQTNVTGFTIFNPSSATLPVFYLDGISLLGSNFPAAATPVVAPSNVVNFGATVTLTSSATGSQPLSYQWQTDGGSGTLTNIPGATSQSLTYTPQAAGSFLFDWVVTNSYGSITSAITTVRVLPLAGIAPANDDYLIYSIQFNNGWGNDGWVDDFVTNYAGSNCLAYAASGTYQALWLTHDAMDDTTYTNLTLWLNGGPTGGQQVYVGAIEGSGYSPGSETAVTAPANTWQQFTFSLTSLGVANTTNLTGITIANQYNVPATFYIADIRLTAAPKPAVVHVGVNVTNFVRTVSSRMVGANNVAWDGSENADYYPGTLAQVTNAAIQALRWPGGSWGDGYHWTNEEWSYGNTSARTWGSFTPDFIQTATNAQVQAFIIANYGTSTPQEAAWGVAMMNITNHCNFKYWEIGNEVGGFWEVDNNTNVPWQAHDPWTYAMRFAQYYTLMKAVDPTIKIGAVADTTEDGTVNYTNHAAVNPVTGVTHYGWTPVMLYTMLTNGVLPDFLIDHSYAPGDGDAYNLQWSAKHWQTDAVNLRMMLNDYLGTNHATNIELDVTEFGPPGGQQYISLVGGLFAADTFGAGMQTEFKTMLWWDQHNGQGVATDPDNALYGWRTNSAGQLIADGGFAASATAPPNADCYPSFYCLKLVKYFARGGDIVITATNDYELLSTYAVRRTNGALTMLVINKSSVSNLTADVKLTGYVPSSNATLYAYGIPQDQAARTGSGSLDVVQTNLTGIGTNFSYTFPPYSANVLVLTPGPPLLIPQAGLLPGGQFAFTVQGQSGVPYVVQTCTNLSSPQWVAIATNTPASGAFSLTNSVPAARRFYRAVWQP